MTRGFYATQSFINMIKAYVARKKTINVAKVMFAHRKNISVTNGCSQTCTWKKQHESNQ
jgi:hypothetical protein